ncbi:MAG: hypothetical protein ACP5K8_04760 [Nitrososphaeria archaeon]
MLTHFESIEKRQIREDLMEIENGIEWNIKGLDTVVDVVTIIFYLLV